MKIITDKRIIEKYSAQFPFQQYFSFDISKDITLAHYETDEFIIQEAVSYTHLRLPSRALLTSSSDGSGLDISNALADIIMPLVQ